jgi:hypothetical protein
MRGAKSNRWCHKSDRCSCQVLHMRSRPLPNFSTIPRSKGDHFDPEWTYNITHHLKRRGRLVSLVT